MQITVYFLSPSGRKNVTLRLALQGQSNNWRKGFKFQARFVVHCHPLSVLVAVRFHPGCRNFDATSISSRTNSRDLSPVQVRHVGDNLCDPVRCAIDTRRLTTPARLTSTTR
jgi:hypothetical protein